MFNRIRSSSLGRVAAFGLGLVALSLVSGAPSLWGQEESSRGELRAQLLPVYRQLLTDPQFQALTATLPGHMEDAAVVDRYLAYLPLSPKEILELDMETRRYEIAVPSYLERWHRRWIELHPAKAREHYGEDALSEGADVWMDEETSLDEALAGLKAATVGTNRNVAAASSPAPTAYQGEIQVVVNPNNANQLVAAANTWNSIPGVCTNQQTQAIFFSANGGTTWNYTCAPGSAAYAGMSCAGTVFGSDPALFWNSNNEVFLNYMLLCSLGPNTTGFSVVVARSVNAGATWTGQGIVKNSWPTVNVVEDKNFYAIDTNPASPFFNRHYTCWDRNNNEKMAYSTNSGVGWTEVDLPTTPSSGSGSAFDLACELEVQKNGTVHVVYDTLRCLGSNPCNNEQMFHSRSTNGGVSWSAPGLVQDFNLVGFSNVNCPPAQNQRCVNPFGAIGVDNSTSACAGNLYAAYTDWTSGGVTTSDIWVRRSTDNGVTWQAPVRVNDDPAGGLLQFHPFLQVDASNGDVVVAWHDARNDALNRAVQIFASRSTNCGQSFETNVQVAQPSSEFNNSTISTSNENSTANTGFNPNQYGEYLGLSVLNQKAHIAWTDTRHYFPAFTTNPQRENLAYANVQWDVCPLSTTSGSFNQSVGATPGSILGAVNNPGNAQILTLAGTVTTGGALTGVLRHPVHNTVYYNVSGTWTITTPPSQGTFLANITELGSGAIAGVIGGTWSDNASISIVGTYAGTWRVCPLVRTDAWSRDLASDTGVEPNPVASPMWTSPDIWVRNLNDGGTAHQNPEAGQVNYIHVNIRNRSLVDAVNVPVKFYFANASTGLSWPTQWTQIGQTTLALVPGNTTAVVVAQVPWSIPTAMTGHFCLVVRIDTPQDPMRFAEGTNISANTQNNNNIVWKNVNIVNLIPGLTGAPGLAQTVEFIFRNVEEGDLKLNLLFEQEKDETGTVGGFLERGTITIELVPEMAEIWAAYGNQGRGIRRIDDDTFMVVEDGGFIYVPLKGLQEFPVKMTFEDTLGTTEQAGKATLRAAPRFYTVSAIQQNASDPKIPIGGVTYQIYTTDGGPPEE